MSETRDRLAAIVAKISGLDEDQCRITAQDLLDEGVTLAARPPVTEAMKERAAAHLLGISHAEFVAIPPGASKKLWLDQGANVLRAALKDA